MNEFTTRDGCTISYRDTGAVASGRTLVMLTGWSQSAAMYDRVIPLLDGDLRVVTYDHRNHGASGRSEAGARIASLAQDLHELLDHLGIGRTHVLGHSMGCSVIWSYIDTRGTGRFDSVVLVDQPSVCALVPWLQPHDAAEVGAIMDFAGAAAFAQALVGPDSEKARRDFLTSMLTDHVSAEDDAFMWEQNLRLAMPFGARLLIDHVMQDWRDVLPRIDVPTLVTAGDVSHVVPSSQRWIAGQIPGSQLRVFTSEEGGAHFPFVESPAHFAEVLSTFLAGVPTPPATAA